MKASRQIVYDTLIRVCFEGGYSNLSLDQAIVKNELDRMQAGFVSALFYGVLETGIQMDYLLQKYVKKPVAALDKEVLTVLRMGLYQLLYLDSVPDSAAVDESVRLTAYARKTSAKGFVNAVLRSFIRDGKKAEWPDRTQDELAWLSIRYACPVWILSQWRDQFGMEIAERLAESSLGRPPLTVRVNTLKTTSEKLIGWLENRGVKASLHPWLENCLVLEDTGSIDRLPQYRQGLFHVQDTSSQLCSLLLEARQGETVLDICAAPGSKSFTIAQQMNSEGQLYAFDLHEHKQKLITDGAKRLGISCIQAQVRDGREFSAEVPLAERVLCDVPCSGLGVIRRKPEIKYKEAQPTLPELQLGILRNAARYVKPGGRLIYSTCTTNRAENEAVVLAFLAQTDGNAEENFHFMPLQLSQIFSKIEGMGQMDRAGITLFPHLTGGDGFYIAVMERRGD